MKKRVVFALSVLCFSSALCEDSGDGPTKNKENAEEFLELGEPQNNISGAYWGLGFGLSSISHNVKATQNGGNEINHKKSANQFDLSLICGFGSAFYKSYYAGLEFDVFKRLGGGTSLNSDETVGIMHNSTIGMNMDVRLGYLFPDEGWLAYSTVGFARVLGRATFNNAAGQTKQEGSFGSFYPTVGFGAERKMGPRWSLRGDFRYSITSKDDGKRVGTWSYEGKPNRMAIRISIARSIL
jgi:hypothetical protein